VPIEINRFICAGLRIARLCRAAGLTSWPTHPTLRIPARLNSAVFLWPERILWLIRSLPLAVSAAAVRAAPRGRVRWARFKSKESEPQRPTRLRAWWVFQLQGTGIGDQGTVFSPEDSGNSGETMQVAWIR
jgi:hypothetical protein